MKMANSDNDSIITAFVIFLFLWSLYFGFQIIVDLSKSHKLFNKWLNHQIVKTKHNDKNMKKKQCIVVRPNGF